MGNRMLENFYTSQDTILRLIFSEPPKPLVQYIESKYQNRYLRMCMSVNTCYRGNDWLAVTRNMFGFCILYVEYIDIYSNVIAPPLEF